jgi:dynein heavy chain, axonemal
LEAKGYHPLDETQMGLSSRQLKEMMSFTDRANKRKYCALLARFLTVCDYMTITLLHHLLAHTFHDLAEVFQVHEALSPSFEYIESHTKTNAVLEKPREAGQPTSPLILAEFRLKPDKIETDPSRDVTVTTVEQLIQLIREAINEVTRFQSDNFFRDFTE